MYYILLAIIFFQIIDVHAQNETRFTNLRKALYVSVDSVHQLDISGDTIISFSDDHAIFNRYIGRLEHLRVLILSGTGIGALPLEIGNLTKLDTLCLDGNRLQYLPSEVSKLHHLKYLDIARNRINSDGIPKEIRELRELEYLDISYNEIFLLPEELAQLISLKKFIISGNHVFSFFSFKTALQFKKLECLIAKDCAFQFFPLNRYNNQLSELKVLHLQDNEIKWIDPVLGKSKKIEELNFSNNKIETLPKNFVALKKLKYLDLSNNNLSELPSNIGRLKNLKELNLKNNQLKEIPKSISNCKILDKLLLDGNLLTTKEKEKIQKLLPKCSISF